MPFFRKATPVEVYLDGAPAPYMRALSCRRTTGGRELDRAEIAFDLAAAGERLVDYEFFRESTDVEIVASIQGEGDVVLHWGKLGVDAAQIRPGVERLTFTSRTEPFHMGGPIAGQWQINPTDANKLQMTPVDVVFNPELDGRCWPNMSPELVALNGIMAPVFLDPESIRTATAKELFGVDPKALGIVAPASTTTESGGAAFWTLAEAVLHVCAALNGNEENVKIPTLDELSLLDSSPDILRDFRLRRGLFLPQALDELLTPFGYGFYVDYLGLGDRRLEVFIRGTSISPSAVTFERPGGIIGDSNAPEFEIEYNRGNVRNSITIHGDHMHVESTFELFRTWPENLDGLDPTTDLAKDSDNFQANPAIRDVWRKWALNESGDYTSVRPEIGQAYDFSADAPNDAANGKPAFGKQIPRRRRFLPCITLSDDLAPIGEVQGCVVEWSADAGATWRPLAALNGHTCHLLERECGVLFDAAIVPDELYSAGANARVRITGTVRMDDRVIGNAKTEASPQTDPAPALVDASSRFHFRLLSPASVYFEQVASGAYPSDAIDDSIAINDYAKHLLSAWNMADLSGTIKVEGLDRTQYQLSDTIYRIEGRGIYLSGVAPDADEIRVPQIVGIDYLLQDGGQYRILRLETYREDA